MQISDMVTITYYSFKKNGISGIKNLALSCLDFYRESLKVFSALFIVQIEPTLYCNLRCQMCMNPFSKREKKHMSFGQFKKIIDDIPFVGKISLVGVGEPLLNPELFKMISYAKSKDILVGFTTNGMLLEEDICRKIMTALPHWINISVDSANKNKFEAIRKGADFSLFLENIKQLLKIKGKNRLPEISFWFVLMKDNLAELGSVIELAKNLGIKKVFSQLQHSWGDNKQLNNGHEMDLAQVKSVLKEATKLARQEKVHFEYVNVPDILGKRQCKWPWKACYITAEGFITACCLHGSDPGLLNFGNIFKEDFESIWNSRLYQDFRQQLKSNSPPSICKGCPGYFSKLRI